jgi:hypothetical protein
VSGNVFGLHNMCLFSMHAQEIDTSNVHGLVQDAVQKKLKLEAPLLYKEFKVE